jgi:hypothetical protein
MALSLRITFPANSAEGQVATVKLAQMVLLLQFLPPGLEDSRCKQLRNLRRRKARPASVYGDTVGGRREGLGLAGS